MRGNNTIVKNDWGRQDEFDFNNSEIEVEVQQVLEIQIIGSEVPGFGRLLRP